MDMNQAPMAQGPGMEGMAAEMGETEGATTVTIVKKPDGTCTVNGEPCENVDKAMAKAAELLGDDRMSVEQAFGKGFQGDRVDGPGY
jgi:hypothetical protein